MVVKYNILQYEMLIMSFVSQMNSFGFDQFGKIFIFFLSGQPRSERQRKNRVVWMVWIYGDLGAEPADCNKLLSVARSVCANGAGKDTKGSDCLCYMNKNCLINMHIIRVYAAAR
jgi:hypothetical protein